MTLTTVRPLANAIAAALIAAAISLSSAPAGADTTDQIVSRLKSNGNSTERYSVDVAGQAIKMGGARTIVHAPISDVRSVVQDYGNYASFMRRFDRSRIVGQNKRFTQVYLSVPILHGAAKVWTVAQFGPPIQRSGTEIIRGRMVEGNVHDFRATWYLTPLDAETTLLQSELLIIPKIPAPASYISHELAYAADVAVSSTRARAERAFKERKAPNVTTK